MDLKLKGGGKMRVGKKSCFEVTDDFELRVSSTGRGAFRTVSRHIDRESAELQASKIESAINRGEKVLYI